ncbi:DNA/RNA non-specific endonuclease, partial [Xenorhabdus nematophila]|uniref:DNA/RNA non-specific endonuclease n=1 Tax=Xenorhabdus nematophila TaxID=628 RepID=UPI0032B7AF6D
AMRVVLIGGIAGAFATNSAQGAHGGAGAGEIVLEHNFLKYDLYKLDRQVRAAKEKGEDTTPIFEKMRKSLAEDRDIVKTTCKDSPTICGSAHRDLANEAIGEFQGIGEFYFDRDVVAFVKTETDKDNAVINDYISTKGEILEYVLNGAGILAGNETKFSIKGKGTNSAHNKQTNQPGSSLTKPAVVVVNSGKTSAWEKQLNKPQPNTIYHVDGNKTYRTDSLSRPVSVEASLTLSSNDRNHYQQRKTGHQGNPGDDGGHLIGTIFNGPGEKLNMVPMESSLNRHGAWRNMERTWADALKSGNTVNVKIQPRYSDNSARPSSFDVSYTIGKERPIELNIKNAAEGK